MRPDHEEDSIDPQKLTGMVLIGIGAMSLLLIAVSVIQIIRNPSKADLIQWMMKTIAGKDAVISGNFDGSTFEIQASEAFQYIFLAIVGLIVLRLMTSIFMAFIKSGTAMMAKAEKDKRDEGNAASSKPRSGPPKLRFPPSD